MSSKAQKARNVKAQGNALGLGLISLQSVEGAKSQRSVSARRLALGVSPISRLQRSTRHTASTWAAGPGYYISRRWRFLLVTVVLTAMVLPGSVAAQKKYERPAVRTPDTFRGSEAVAPTDQTSIGDIKWFEVFKDEELQKLVRTAMIQNYDLRAAVARINAARANLGLARSDQFPQFEATADLTTSRGSRNGPLGASGQGGRTRSFGSVLLNLLNFEIDVWGRLRQQTRAARAELRASEEDRKAVLTTVVGDVATGYFSLLELDSELDIDKHPLAIRENSLNLIKLRQQGGLATMLDVRQAEELVYQASETIPDTERG